MDLLITSIKDPAKASAAKDLIKSFRSNIRECDKAASDNDIRKILDIYPTSASQLKDFFGLLQDVPDEI
jgi:hypothetical protein